MTTANDAIRKTADRLPLRVIRAEWQDPVLLLHGEDWRMTVMTPWRILSQERFLLGSDDVEPEVVADLLAGNVVTACKQQSSAAVLDPQLVFASGHILEIFSVSPLEPWILAFGSAEVFVASPSE